MKTRAWLKEMHHLGNQLELFVASQFFDAINGRLHPDTAIMRFENNSFIVPRFDAHPRPQRQRKIHGRGQRVKEIYRPDVDGSAGQINSGRGG